MASRKRHQRGRLMMAAQTLLKKSKRPMIEISINTGIGVDWLNRFKADKIGDPGVNRIEALYCYLSGAVLNLER